MNKTIKKTDNDFRMFTQEEIDKAVEDLDERVKQHDKAIRTHPNLGDYERRKARTSSVGPQRDAPGGSTPHQYGLPEGATELQDLIEHRRMNFAMGNIFKACYRAGTCSHSSRQRDLRKIIWFAQRELDRKR